MQKRKTSRRLSKPARARSSQPGSSETFTALVTVVEASEADLREEDSILTRATGSLAQMASALKGGAAQVEILTTSADQVASSINEVAASMEQVTANTAQAASASAVVASSIRQITASAQSVAQNSQEMAASAQETTTTLTEVASSVQRVNKDT